MMSLRNGQRHVLGGLEIMGSGGRESRLVERCGTCRGRNLRCSSNSRVSVGCEGLGCIECTSSFLVKVVNDGRSTVVVGRSVGGFLCRGLTLALSSRGALVARTRGTTGFLKCRVFMEGSGSAGEDGCKMLEHIFGGEVRLTLKGSAFGGGLLRCHILRVGVRGNGRC